MMEMVTDMARLSAQLQSAGGPLAMLIEESYHQGLLIQQSSLRAASEWVIRLVQENTPDILVVREDGKEFALFHSSVCRIHNGKPCAIETAFLDDRQERLPPGSYKVWQTRPDREETVLRFERV